MKNWQLVTLSALAAGALGAVSCAVVFALRVDLFLFLAPLVWIPLVVLLTPRHEQRPILIKVNILLGLLVYLGMALILMQRTGGYR